MINLLKNKRAYLQCIICLFVAGAVGSCDKQTVYHTFHSIPAKGWERKDTLFFNAEVTDSMTSYALSIEVRNRNNYPYRNLGLSISCCHPDGHTCPADTLSLTLVTPRGTWKGNGWGSLYQSTFPADSVRIDKPGSYLFKIAYTLPDDTLQGINDIGIRLSRNNR